VIGAVTQVIDLFCLGNLRIPSRSPNHRYLIKIRFPTFLFLYLHLAQMARYLVVLLGFRGAVTQRDVREVLLHLCHFLLVHFVCYYRVQLKHVSR
jgi:hypothetical protein